MADLGFVEGQIQSLPAEMRPALLRLFRGILRDLRFGHPTGDTIDPMVNMAGAFLHATTPAIAGTEFSIAHSFGRTPYLAVPVLRLDAIGSSVVPLTVARAADDKRIYLTSTEQDAPITLAVEG